MKLRFLPLAGLGAALALAAPAAFAQTTPTTPPAQPGPGGRMGRGIEMLKSLNLTADQQTKIEAIMREGRPAGRPSGPPTEAERQAMQARRAELETKIKAVLTPEQVTQYEALRKQQRPGPPAGSY